ncbi:MAG: prolipoprotein diacylglyceryl transferase [Candidatus Glassbacteria bacterium]|nr:prolipoprotein diacylglyceryl transferase [Candidatus Glassbacteria bacterium]
MHPVIFRLGPLEIKSYGVMLAVSFLVGYLFARKRAVHRGIRQEALLDLCFWILLSAIVGSRAFYIATHWDQYADSPLGAFSIWEGGLSMMGGVLMALAVGWLFLKKAGVRFTQMADVVAPSIALGIGLTRIGCFLYGCCYGLPTDLALGITFPEVSAAGSHFHVPIHPTQLYSSAYGFAILGILMLIDRFRPREGALFGIFAMLYAIARFTVDFYRYYEPQQYVTAQPAALTNNQIISMALFVFGAVLAVRAWRNRTVEAVESGRG